MSFSVLMSVYEKEKPQYLQEALESVFTQSLPPDEVVLIEDGSLTDALYQVIASFREKYPALRTHAFAHNVKLGRALKKGVELCSNELIARMDTDDIACKNRFRVQYDFMESHPQIAACGGFIEEFDDDGTIHQVKTMPQSSREIASYAKMRNPLNHMTVMFRKSEVLKAGNYRDFPLLEDYDLWSRMLSGGAHFANLPEVLVKARVAGALYERRGGGAYCARYLTLRKEQKELGLLSGAEYLKAAAATLGMTLLPSGFRKFVYVKILRRNV